MIIQNEKAKAIASLVRKAIAKLDTAEAPSLLKVLEEMENPPTPLTRELTVADMDADGYVKGNVAVSWSAVNVTEYDGEHFLDLLSTLLIGSEGLLDMDYRLVDVLPNDTLVIEVSGDANLALKGWDKQ